MPLVVVALASLGVEQQFGWRLAMLVPGAMLLVMAVLYHRYAKDTPRGNVDDTAHAPGAKRTGGWSSFVMAARDYRVWLLFVTYGACFGVELTLHNIAALHFVDQFGLSLRTAGLYAGSFGLLALFARALGGIASDRIAHGRGLDGRTALLFVLILFEGAGLIAFALASSASTALLWMLGFGLFTHMACGATYALTPFVNRAAMGGVVGIVGAGGNVGAVAAGFLLKGSSSMQHGLLTLGIIVTSTALCALAVRFSAAHKDAERQAYADALAGRRAAGSVPALASEGATP
jgi:NNP family nitrate/nitrite transporter-like MFS transporter